MAGAVDTVPGMPTIRSTGLTTEWAPDIELKSMNSFVDVSGLTSLVRTQAPPLPQNVVALDEINSRAGSVVDRPAKAPGAPREMAPAVASATRQSFERVMVGAPTAAARMEEDLVF